MRVTCWGTRGSIPVPGPETVRYGGNTTCVELQLHDGTCLIFDAGTGIRKLGNALLEPGTPVEASIFFTHVHWDHIQGFPFFIPAYQHGNRFTIYGYPQSNHRIRNTIVQQMEGIHFPVRFNTMKASFTFVDLNKRDVHVADATISCTAINHPDGGVGFRVEEQGKVFVFIPDNDLTLSMIDPVFQRIARFCEHADLLIHDSHFTPEEYKLHPTWGHSTYVQTAHLAVEAGVKRLALFHHAPEHSDEEVEQIVKAAQEEISRSGAQVECFGAIEYESMIL